LAQHGFNLRPKSPDDYENNLWVAIEDMYVDMFATAGMTPEEIEEIIQRDVRIYVDEMRQWTLKEVHKQTAPQKRKYR